MTHIQIGTLTVTRFALLYCWLHSCVKVRKFTKCVMKVSTKSRFYLLIALLLFIWSHPWRVMAADASHPPSAVRRRWPTPCRSCWSWRWTWREVEPTPLRRWNQKWWAPVPTSLLPTATPTTSVFRVYWRLWSLRNQRRPEGDNFCKYCFWMLMFSDNFCWKILAR